MQPDDDRAVETLPGFLRPLLELIHPAARVQADSEAVGPLDLEAVEAGGGHARGRVARGEKPRRQVGAAVTGKVRRDGKGAEVDGVAARHFDREGRPVEHDGLDRLLEALGILLGEARFVDAESRRQPSPARHDVRDDGHRVAADLLEDQDGEASPSLELEGQRLRLVREIDRLADAHHLARVGLLQRRHEAAEALARHVVAHRSRLRGVSAPRGL